MLKKSLATGAFGGLLIGVLWTLGGSPVDAHDDEGGFRCTERTLRGTYGGQIQGTRPVPPPLGGGFETIIGVVIRTYDGAGNFTQVDNVKGSVTGITPDRPGFGTYTVSSDCTAIFEAEPAPGIVLQERAVILSLGREIRSITASPASVMVTSVGHRIDRP